jgi:hypothetical protein
MKSFPVVIAVMTAALLATSGVQGQESTAPPPEMKVFHKMVGTWQSNATSRVAEWTPEETHEKATGRTDLILEGHFFLGRMFDSEGKLSQVHLHTYDKEQQVYRTWSFLSNGSCAEYVGKYDEGSNTLKLKHEKRGITTLVSNHFVDEDTWDVSVVAKDQQGKVYIDMHLKGTRQK